MVLACPASASTIYRLGLSFWASDQTLTGIDSMATGQDRQTLGGRALSPVLGKWFGNFVYDLGPPGPSAVNGLRNVAGWVKNLLRNPSKAADDVIDLADELAAPNNTVWERIKPTQDVWPGTEIPRSFELTTQSGQRVWVHGNATEHLAERVVGANGPKMRIELGRIIQQSQLASLEAAVNAATKNGIAFNQPIRIGGWQLVFRPGRNVGDLPALIEALPLE
jgi:hypothetical protein